MSYLNVLLLIAFLLNICISRQDSPLIYNEDCNNEDVPLGKCCKLINLYPDKVKEECYKYLDQNFTDGEAIDFQYSQDIFCFSTCVLNVSGIMNEGTLNEENMSLYLNDVMSDNPDMIPFAKEVFRECFVATEYSRNLWLPVDEEGFCSYDGLLILDCVYKKIFFSCPNSAWTETEECKELKDIMQNCQH